MLADAPFAEAALEAADLPGADFAEGAWVFCVWAGDAIVPEREQRTSNIPGSKAKRTLRGIPYILVPQNGRGIRIFSEGFAIAFGKNLHHPAVEIINRLIENRMEAAVVFLTSFINITAQPCTDIFVFAAEANVLGP